MRGYAVGKHLSLAALHLVIKHLWARPDCRDLNEKKKSRCLTFDEVYGSIFEAADQESQCLGPLGGQSDVPGFPVLR